MQVIPLNSKQLPLLRGEVHRGSAHIPSPLEKTGLSFTPHQSAHSPGWRLPPRGQGDSREKVDFTMATTALNGTGSSSSYYKSLGPPEGKAGLSQWLTVQRLFPTKS